MKRLRQLLAIFMTITMLFTGTSLSDFSMFSFAAEDEDNVVVSQEMESPAEDSAQADDMEQKAEDSNQDVQTDQSKDDTESNADADTPASDKDTEDKSASSAGELQTKIKLSDDSKWIVTAAYSERAGIPDNAELVIEEVDEEDTGDYLKDAVKTLKWADEEQAAYARFLNISITSEDKTIQPAAEIEITIEADDADDEILEKMQVVRFGDEKDKKAKTEELECEITDDGELVFPTDKLAVFGFLAAEESGLVHKTLKANKVRLEGMMPEDAKATATDASSAKAVSKLEGGEGTTLAAYDITIKSDGEEFQPDEAHPIEVRISDKAIKEDSNLTIWHIADDGTKEQVEDFTISNGAVTFEATGFSVYAVIDHEGENGNVLDPRVEFHFIAPLEDDSQSSTGADNTVLYTSTKYEFRNKSANEDDNIQTTQILKSGESLELITDPENQDGKNFYGWYVVDYSSSTDDSITYSWPGHPDKISFGKPITIQKSTTGEGQYEWSLNGASGSGAVDNDGNIHVYLAPVFEDYSFVNFMLYPRGQTSASSANNLITRKMVVKGSADEAEVKISDIRSMSTDPVHLIFTGWEYNDGTEWVQYQTVDYTGTEIKDEDKDGVYLKYTTDNDHIDLYPIFVEARWTDFVVGLTGNGADYVPSRFLESWGTATPTGTDEEPNKNIFTSLKTSKRDGYQFGGWYAFAKTDSNTGEILNLTQEMPVTVSYIDINDNRTVKTKTIETTAIQIADGNGNIVYNETYTLPGTTLDLFGVGEEPGSLKFYDALDRLSLCANWLPDKSQITLVYWTEKAQEEDYEPTDDPKDDYAASAVRPITTEELNEKIGGNFGSGSTITLADLQTYMDGSVSIVDPKYLYEAGAVSEEEEKFYDLNDEDIDNLSDVSKVINGDGSTIFNVYYSRKVFKLVFHIGRDGYVKHNGQQRESYMSDPRYSNWDGNWIQFMYGDSKITNPVASGGLGYVKGPTAASYTVGDGVFSMSYTDPKTGDVTTATSEYVTTPANVLGNYVPEADENVYVIEAKYGAYIGDRWPTPVNENFDFTDPANSTHAMYTWAAYYGSLYCYIAHHRNTYENPNGNNPDINGVYDYMSRELCANRSGDEIINAKQVHHLVAYFGEKGKEGIIKNYHILYEAIDGTYDPGTQTTPGSGFMAYNQTTWSTEKGDSSKVDGHDFYEVVTKPVISNVDAKFQLGSDIEGYDMIYSCYNAPDLDHQDVYFFYRPKQYKLTFMYENEADRKTDTYYYTESLANAKKPQYKDPSKEGYSFEGWYTNEAGFGDPFDFANETMPSANVVLYPVLKPLQYMVKIDPNGGVINHRAPGGAQATYFNAYYGTTVGEYTVPRDYIKLTDKEQNPSDPTYVPEQERYYYLNTQFIGGEDAPDGDWGYPADLRNALYLTEDQLYDYYTNVYCYEIDHADPEYWTNIKKLPYDVFKATFTTYPYRRVGSEHYTFMGWYQVHDDGTVDTMPYNFNDPVTGPLELRANWRLDGGYYVEYEDESGSLWHDPENLSEQLYADQALIKIMHAPTNVPAGKVFRGWYVVDPNGEPFQRDEHGDTVYYQPGDNFVIDSALVTEEGNYGKIIHMKAYYESEDETYRRPDITNLILDANQEYGRGYVNTTDSTRLPALAGPGSTSINTDAQTLDTEGKPTQILFGDIQSNLALHLNKYENFFDSHENYLLIGFDENADPEHPSTDTAYIPAFASDAVAAVTRDDHRTLYAMWEPKIYATFVNTTDEPITINLSGDGASVVNIVTGEDEYGRVATTGQIIVPAKSGDVSGSVKVVFPAATDGDIITATAVNDHANKKMSVSGTYHGQPYPEGCEHIKYGKTTTYTGALKAGEDGIFVTYTEELDKQVLFDDNGGNWTDPDTGEDQKYYHVDGDLYAIDDYKIVENNYKPTDPTKEGKVFVGWTTNEDIAGHTDFSSETAVTWGGTTITPDAGSNVLDKVKSDYLWDFSLEPPFGQTLYAVWSETVTVTFNIVRDGSNLHQWTGPATTTTQAPEVYYRSSENSGSITYTLAKGARVPKPEDPTADSSSTTYSNWHFLKWLLNNTDYKNKAVSPSAISPSNTSAVDKAYDFSRHVTENIILSTSWTTSVPQTFTFTVENRVENGDPNDEFTYTIAVGDERVYGKLGNGGNTEGVPDRRWGSVNTVLKNNQQYTVLVTVSHITNWGGADSVGIEVIDRDGTIIKSGQVIYCNNNTYTNFVSDYKYKLKITQTEKANYDTAVTVEDNNNVKDTDPPSMINDEERTFTFTSAKSWSNPQRNNFLPEINKYASGENNSLTVVFTNTCTIVSPTGYFGRILPFLLILIGGLLLGCLLQNLRRRRNLEE